VLVFSHAKAGPLAYWVVVAVVSPAHNTVRWQSLQRCRNSCVAGQRHWLPSEGSRGAGSPAGKGCFFAAIGNERNRILKVPSIQQQLLTPDDTGDPLYRPQCSWVQTKPLYFSHCWRESSGLLNGNFVLPPPLKLGMSTKAIGLPREPPELSMESESSSFISASALS